MPTKRNDMTKSVGTRAKKAEGTKSPSRNDIAKAGKDQRAESKPSGCAEAVVAENGDGKRDSAVLCSTPGSQIKKRAHGNRYGVQDIERGLIAVAEANGNTGLAAKTLKAEGLTVTAPTLSSWSRKTHLERYEAIQAEVLPRLRERAAEEHRDLIARGMAVERQISDRLANKLHELPVKELPGAQRNIATSVGIHSDKIKDLGEPTNTPLTDIAGLIRGLHELGIEINLAAGDGSEVIDATAIEETVPTDSQ